MKTRFLKIGLLSYTLLVASALIWPVSVRTEQTPTEAIASCIRNAWHRNYACQNDGNWWNDVPCAVKFEADAILCASVLL